MRKIIAVLLVLMMSANTLVMFAGDISGEEVRNRQGGPYYHQIYSATSTNGINWTVNTTMLFDHASVPGAVYFNNKLYLYYVNAADPENEKLSVGVSTDKGATFTVYDVHITGANSPYPVDPNPIVDGNKIRLTYLGNFMQGGTNKIVTATSSDGTNFTEDGVIFTEDVFDPDLFYYDVGGQWVLFTSSGTSLTKATSSSPTATFTKDTSFSWNAGGISSTHKIGSKYYTYYAGMNGISVAEYSYGTLSNIADGIASLQGMGADPTVAVFGANDYKMFFKIMVGGGTPEEQITVNFTGSTYKNVTEKPSGWFSSGQNADIMLSGIDFNNTGGPLLFNHPTGIASDGTHLLLADTWNNRVLIWNSLPTGNVTPNIVLGQENFYSNNPGRGLNQMNWPMGVSTDGQRVVVADTCNDRILIWNTFPTYNGQPANLVIEGDPAATYPTRRIDWPWGIWTNGVKIVVSSTSTASVLIWNNFPTQTNQSADIYLTGQGQIGTPRNIVSDGTRLIVGDHNPNVPGATGQGNFFWSSFPTTNDQMPTFFMSDPGCPGGAWMRGEFTQDGKLVLLGVGLYIWNTFPASNTTSPDLTVGVWWPEPGGSKYWFHPAEGAGLTLAGSKLYTTSNNVIIGFNSLPTTGDAQPDFAVGGPDAYTNTLETNYIIQNPVPASDGTSLFVSSDAQKLYVWKNLPDESSAKPDVVYTLPFAPWDSAIFENRLVLAGKDYVYIWDELPLNGELPDERFKGSIGDVTFQDLKGVELDEQYFYLSDRDANKIYIWEGIPNQTANPKFSLDIQVPTGLSSDGTYLIATATEATNTSERIKFYRIDQLSSGGQPTLLTGINVNLPQAALSVNGHLFVADTGFNRILLWNSISDAVDGKFPDIVLGEKDFNDTLAEIGINKLFMPAALTFDGSYLWVGEFKFSGRVVRFSVKLIPHEPIYIDGNANFTSANGVIGGNGTESNPYIIEGWDINASTVDCIYIRNTISHFIIRNCAVHDGKSNSKHGIYFYSVENGKMDYVTSYNNYDGIYLYSSSNNNITNCYVYDNNDYGILLESSSNNQITNCTVYNNSDDGVHLYSSSNNTITNCYVYNNDDGILLRSSSNNNITNCYVYNNFDYGIWLDSSSNNNITNCYVYNNFDYGIDLSWYSSNNNISNCSVYNNSWDGIYLHSSSNNNIITNCNVYKNSWRGIYLDSSSNNAITNCYVYNNSKYGIRLLYYSSNNLIYNNYFNNTNNAYSSGGSGNCWNITKTFGTNIINGPYLGGNYWSDYTGVDINGDGFGDTPYTIPGGSGEQDNLPLVKVADTEKPQISNVNDVPDPQEVYGYVNITCTVTDNVAINVVKVNIMYPNGTTKNITMMQVGISSYSYNTTYSVLGTYSYYIWADDINGNQNKSSIYTFLIRDSTKPSITNVQAAPASQTVGGYVNITCTVTDNIEVSVVRVNITGPAGFTQINTTMARIGTTNNYYYNALYSISGTYNYYIMAKDTSDNQIESLTYQFIITSQDTTKPVLSNVQASPSTQTQGGYVNITCTVTDNVGISMVKVSITGPTGFAPVNTTMTKIAGANNYYYNSPYSTAGTYSYYIWANDTSANGNKSSTCQFAITLPVTTVITVIDGREVNVTGVATGTITITSAALPQVPPETLQSIGIQVNVTITGELTYANIAIKYSDSDVAGTDETKLRMYYWGGSQWQLCDNTGVDTINNIVWANVTHLTIFAPMGEKVSVNLPPTAVLLYEPAEITANSMLLSWTQNTDSDFSNYTIYQSTTSGNMGAAIYTTITQSTTSYTVIALSPSTTYYFTVRVYDTGGLYNDSSEVSGTTLTAVTTGNLTGTVTDKNSKPIEGATVSIVATSHVTWTDSNGRYTFTGVSASSYQVKVEKSGYKTKTETGIVINAGVTTTLDIVLEEEKKEEPKGFIPGFEAVTIIIALGVVILLRRKLL